MIKEPYLKNYPWSLQLFAFFAIMFICLFLFNLLGLLVIRPFFGIDIMQENVLDDFTDENVVAAQKTMAMFVSIGLFLVPCLIFSKLVASPGENYLRTEGKINPPLLLIILFISVFSIPVINFMYHLNARMEFPDYLGTEENIEFQSVVLNTTSFQAFLGNVLVFAVFPAIGEELFFRSILLRFFYRSSGNIHLAIITGGLIFAFMHFQPSQFLPIAAMGILYGYIFFRTGNIWYSVAAHLANNFTSIVIEYLTARGQVDENLRNYGAGENETIPLVISFILLTGSVILLFKRTSGTGMKNGFY